MLSLYCSHNSSQQLITHTVKNTLITCHYGLTLMLYYLIFCCPWSCCVALHSMTLRSFSLTAQSQWLVLRGRFSVSHYSDHRARWPYGRGSVDQHFTTEELYKHKWQNTFSGADQISLVIQLLYDQTCFPPTVFPSLQSSFSLELLCWVGSWHWQWQHLPGRRRAKESEYLLFSPPSPSPQPYSSC